MTATRRRRGTISCNRPSLLPPSSEVCCDRPVTLPPGRAILATKPLTTGSVTVVKTIGVNDVACFAAITAPVTDVKMTSTFSRTNSAAISQPLKERSTPFAVGCRCASDKTPDSWQLPRLLRTHHERPRCRCATEKRDKLAALHIPPHR